LSFKLGDILQVYTPLGANFFLGVSARHDGHLRPLVEILRDVTPAAGMFSDTSPGYALCSLDRVVSKSSLDLRLWAPSSAQNALEHGRQQTARQLASAIRPEFPF
jgi:hypothetical protein